MTEQGVTHHRGQAALQLWGTRKDPQTFAAVMRECVAGELLLDTSASRTADPQNPFQPGDTLAIAEQVDNAGKRLLLAYTDHARLQARNRAPSTSLVQPAAAVLEMAMSRYDGIAIDARHPDLFIGYTPELVQNLTEKPSANTPLKTALLERSLPWDQLLELVGSAPVMFVPFRGHRDEAGELVGVSTVTANDPQNGTLAVACTSPAEAWAWAPGVGAQATTFAQIARAALTDGHPGVLLNPAGGTVLITADELRALSAETPAG